MTTLTLTLLRPLLATDSVHWLLAYGDAFLSLAHLQPEQLLARGEVERFVWWTHPALPATLRACDAQALLADYAAEFKFHCAPDCTAERTELHTTGARQGCVELELRVTHRVARQLYEALDLDTSRLPSAPARPAKAPALASFEARLRLWLAGHGVSQAETDIVCAQPRVAACIRDADAGDLVRELPSALYRARETGQEARTRLNEAGEMLLLMNCLSPR